MDKAIIYLTFILFLCGCGDGRKAPFSTDGLEALYIPEYSSGFGIFGIGESSVIEIRDPWQAARDVRMHIFLSRSGELPPEGFEGAVVRAPLERVVCMSSSYIAFIDAIGAADAIKGVSGARFITDPKIRERCADGEVRDVGYDAYMNYELLATLKPDLVFIYGISGENGQLTGKLSELGIQYAYIGDYVEQSPLGKAEWIAAFGEMFDKLDPAVKLFSEIRDSYNDTKEMVADYLGDGRRRPVVMLNAPYRDVWYVPGDRSYMVRLLGDAGGSYACAGEDNAQSRPVSGESAYISASRSDVWLNPGQASSMAEVVSFNPRFSDIPPVRSGRVFNCNARTSPEGGSDFWESGAVRPDIVLRDMAGILHPGLLPGREPYYFRQMR